MAPVKWIVDNSVIQRIPRAPEVRAALADVVDAGDWLCSTVVTVLEAGFSVRTAPDHRRLLEGLTLGYELIRTESGGSVALELQSALWVNGQGRAAGARDLLIAGEAIASGCGVLHYDANFEHIASVDPRLRHRWVVDRGSID